MYIFAVLRRLDFAKYIIEKKSIIYVIIFF